MKKIKRNDLRLEKEVISALTESDLNSVKGGIEPLTQTCQCPIPDHPISYYPEDCRTMDTCLVSLCKACGSLDGVTCMIPATDLNVNCGIAKPISKHVNCAI